MSYFLWERKIRTYHRITKTLHSQLQHVLLMVTRLRKRISSLALRPGFPRLGKWLDPPLADIAPGFR